MKSSAIRNDYLNIAVLAVCEAIFMSTALINVAVAGLAAQAMVTDQAYVTLPQATIPLVSMAITIPASFIMKKIGRRAGFAIGALAGVASGIVCALALMQSSFSLFIIGVAMMGIYQAFATYYRFAVADQAEDAAFRSKAVSLVLAGGVIAAVAGPTIATYTRELVPSHLFVGCYLAVAGLNGLALLVLTLLRLRGEPRAGVRTGKLVFEPRRIFKDVRIVAAMLFCGMGNATMMLVMTATPIAMAGCGFGLATSGVVISWHVAAMFLPFFFTGYLIEYLGLYRFMMVGLVLTGLSGVIAASGISVGHFGLALMVSGLGWNFMYAGGSTLLANVVEEEDRPLAQGMNEFMSFGMTTFGTFASGMIYSRLGWSALNTGAVLLAVLLLALFTAMRQRAPSLT